MRLGKPLEHLQAALRATLAAGPIEETLTTIARQLGYFGYLTYDAVVWVCLSNLHAVPTTNSITGQQHQVHLSRSWNCKEGGQEGLPILVCRYYLQPGPWCSQGGHGNIQCSLTCELTSRHRPLVWQRKPDHCREVRSGVRRIFLKKPPGKPG